MARSELPEGSAPRSFFEAYAAAVQAAALQIDPEKIDRAFELLEEVLDRDCRIYVGGNGGSAAIADHLCCDWMKGTYDSRLAPLRVSSLSSNTALLTALSNDCGYENSLSLQVEMMGKPGDLLVLISSSGNSLNIIKAAEAAKQKNMKVLGFSGFAGGKLKELSDVSLHVPVNNYGMVEDIHQMLMHAISQFLAKIRGIA